MGDRIRRASQLRREGSGGRGPRAPRRGGTVVTPLRGDVRRIRVLRRGVRACRRPSPGGRSSKPSPTRADSPERAAGWSSRRRSRSPSRPRTPSCRGRLSVTWRAWPSRLIRPRCAPPRRSPAAESPSWSLGPTTRSQNFAEACAYGRRSGSPTRRRRPASCLRERTAAWTIRTRGARARGRAGELRADGSSARRSPGRRAALEGHDGFAPRVRIGIHAASATDRGDDYSGRGVHATARIAAAADAGEIIASGQALAAASDGFRVSDERELELKGLADPVTVATVDWSDA
jgi:hypothetical protein